LEINSNVTPLTKSPPFENFNTVLHDDAFDYDERKVQLVSYKLIPKNT
jgi:hypothetical protein